MKPRVQEEVALLLFLLCKGLSIPTLVKQTNEVGMGAWEPRVSNDPAGTQKVVLGWREIAWKWFFVADARSRECEVIVYWGNASNGNIGVSFLHLEECALTGSRFVQRQDVVRNPRASARPWSIQLPLHNQTREDFATGFRVPSGRQE